MADIEDSGKVWCKGSTGPIHAVRAANKIFATGKKEGQEIECWVDGDTLCVVLHEPDQAIRVARRFPLDLEPTIEGSLFNGFTLTKHADLPIVSPEQDRIEEKIISGESYRQYQNMDSKSFWQDIWK